jgi:SNF2 family DNA or RNA helicase
MASFDRINGQFVARCTFDERLIFKRAGWLVDPKLKRWATSDVEKARPLAELAIGNAKEFLDSVERIRNEAMAASWAEDTDTEFPRPSGLVYMPFQKAGIEYAVKRKYTLIADPPGLGKTVQAIGIHNVLDSNRILIIPPASLKVNWSREWRKWDVHGRSVGIAMSIPHSKTEDGFTRTWVEHSWPDTDVVIVNYDMLPAFDSQIKRVKWDLVVCDEAHLLKTATALRTKYVFGGTIPARKKDGKTVEKMKKVMPIAAAKYLFLTGTPIMSKPVELWTLLKVCDPRGLGRDYDEYVFRYCDAYDAGFGLDVSGASNLEELNRLLRERFMVRRDKKAVLKDLPPKTRELIVLSADKLEKPVRKERTRVEKALNAFESMMGISHDDNPYRYMQAIEDLSGKLTDALAAQNSEEPDWNAAIRTLSEPDRIMFTEISDAREEVALAKVGLVVEHLLKLHEAGEPVICFAYHKSVIAEIRTRLEKAGLRVGVVTGDIPANKRQAVVDAFQDGKLDVILGNILAMGVGFTLTRAQFVVFAEIDWVPSMLEQAEDRAWRHGQLNAVFAQYLVVDGSIEAIMVQAVLEKMGVIFAALDGRV